MKSVQNPPEQPEIDALQQERARASRRSAILSGLGKGSVALAAMSPLASQASRSHVLFNPLKGTDCYCTVSGFQSAAVSPSTGTNPPTCSTYLPRTFLQMTAVGGAAIRKIVYANDVAPVNNNKIAEFLNGLLGITSITGTQVGNTLRAATPVPLIVAGSHAEFLPLGAPNANAGCYFLRDRNFPTGVTSTNAFSSVFTSGDARTLLEVLFEGVPTTEGGVSNSPPTAKCYFLASYLSINNGNVVPVLPADFDRAYVTGQYHNDGDAALSSNAGLFFSKLCSQSA